ncbi:hypothetical protein JCM16303_002310 [Sporobolomyces ruberrimus]
MPSHSTSSTTSSRQRFSLSSFTTLSTSSSSSSLRRLSTASSTDQPSSGSSSDSKVLPTIPFAEPPFMPMFKSSNSPMTVTIEGLEGGNTEVAQTFSTACPSTSQSTSTFAPAPSTPTQGTSRHSKRFFRRLHKRGNGRGELDFGCVGEWNEGPSDLSSSYYDSHKSKRSSSSSIEIGSPTHSRAHSSSSAQSFSTAASSLPPSPTLGCDAFLAPHPSRVPLSPRAASKKRQTEEAAAVDALNDYFVKVRLSQIEEDAPSHSVTISDSTYSAPPPALYPHAQGLAIYGSSTKKVHDRSSSRDLEIEFIETGHTTFTPLSSDSPSYSSAILLPEDAFFASPSDEGTCYDIDMGEDSFSTCTTESASGRTPVPETEIGPALDELSTFFSSPPQKASPAAPRSSTFFLSTPDSPPLYSRSRRPDSFQAARQARQSGQAVRYDWI